MSLHSQPIYKSQQFDTIDNSPQKQQWAIINKYKALQFQKMKAKQRQIDRQKKQKFRRELDNQLNNRNNAQERERQMDKILFNKMIQKAQNMRRREENQKYEKFIKRKGIQDENQINLQYSKLSKSKDYDTGYHLDIGMKSQIQHKQKSEFYKKNMLDTLDIQLKQKQQQLKRNKILNNLIQQSHIQKSDSYFQAKERKKYGQNQKVYQYYNQIDYQKQMKDRQMQYLMVETPYQRKIFLQKQRQRMEQQKRLKDKQIVKYTLDAQVKESNKKKIENNRINPEDISYGFISNMFRTKQQAYDPQMYKKQLLKQAQEQRQRKIKENHMSQQQYRFNMNQLSKAVVGTYSQKNYLDRSLGAIGDNKKYQLEEVKYNGKDKDADIIKNKLNLIRNKANQSYVEDRQSYL